MRHERIKILNQIELLKNQLCENCIDVNSAKSDIVLCECPAAVKIRKLGVKYEKLTSPRVWDKVLDQIKKDGKVTIEQYVFLKKHEVVDELVYSALQVSKNDFQGWKYENELFDMQKKSDSEMDLIVKKHGDITFHRSDLNTRPVRRTYTKEEREYAISLKKNKTYREVSEITGISARTLTTWMDRRRKGAI